MCELVMVDMYIYIYTQDGVSKREGAGNEHSKKIKTKTL
jgi:hypothetical protein